MNDATCINHSDAERWKGETICPVCANARAEQAEAANAELRSARDSAVEMSEKHATDFLREHEKVRVLTEALEPFARCEIESFGSMPDEKVFLWKPSQTSRDCPGISISDIKRAQEALAAAKEP